MVWHCESVGTRSKTYCFDALPTLAVINNNLSSIPGLYMSRVVTKMEPRRRRGRRSKNVCIAWAFLKFKFFY